MKEKLIKSKVITRKPNGRWDYDNEYLFTTEELKGRSKINFQYQSYYMDTTLIQYEEYLIKSICLLSYPYSGKYKYRSRIEFRFFVVDDEIYFHFGNLTQKTPKKILIYHSKLSRKEKIKKILKAA